MEHILVKISGSELPPRLERSHPLGDFGGVEDRCQEPPLVRPRLQREPGLGAAAITITERIRELGFDAEAEDIAACGRR